MLAAEDSVSQGGGDLCSWGKWFAMWSKVTKEFGVVISGTSLHPALDALCLVILKDVLIVYNGLILAFRACG